MTALVTLENVSVRYGRHVALHEVSGSFHRGSLTAVAGQNGAGKSSLLKVIAGVVKPSAGNVNFPNGRPTKLAYLPQATAVNRDFPVTVEEAVASGLWRDVGAFGAVTAAMKGHVAAALKAVGLEDFGSRQIAALSGGQFQKLLFARVFVQDADLILLDEPFTAIDAETTSKLIQLILEWHKKGKTVICVLHDLLMIQKYFPDSFVLAGKCLGHGHTHHLLEQKLLTFDLDMAELCAGPETEGHCHHD